ncbi:MAG: hypothetical protein ACI91T_001141 [Natronomonas sp.]|jgi:hypothetical protein
MVRIRDVLSLGLAVQLLLMMAVGASFGAIGVLVDPAAAVPAWYDVYVPLAITCLVVGLGLAWLGLDRWPWIAPGGVWNVALLGFGGVMVSMAAGGLLDFLTGAPPTPELPSIGRAIGWGLGLLGGVIVGWRREWLVRDDATDDRTGADGGEPS